MKNFANALWVSNSNLESDLLLHINHWTLIKSLMQSHCDDFMHNNGSYYATNYYCIYDTVMVFILFKSKILFFNFFYCISPFPENLTFTDIIGNQAASVMLSEIL